MRRLLITGVAGMAALGMAADTAWAWYKNLSGRHSPASLALIRAAGAVEWPEVKAPEVKAPAPRWLLPPPQYDHPFDGELIIVTAPDLATLRMACRWDVRGCAQLYGRSCTVIMPPEIWGDRQDREAVLRHEIAHCNGWPAHHPGAIGPNFITCEERYTAGCSTLNDQH